MKKIINVFVAMLLSFSMFTAQADNVVLTGEATQGGVLFGQVPAGSQIKLNGTTVQISDDGEFVLGFGRDAKATHQLRIIYPGGEQKTQTINIKQREYNVQRIDGLPSKQVDMPAARLARYQAELKKIKQARALFQPSHHIFATMIWPVKGRISGVFGSQRILNGKPKRPHYGLDIAAPEGTPIVAPLGGRVAVVIKNGVLIGNTVILDHGHGVTSTMIHLHKINVAEGQWLHQGDAVGEVGQTGRATGPHLHWGMNWFGKRLDPALFLD